MANDDSPTPSKNEQMENEYEKKKVSEAVAFVA
jgi:hypothetical protein